MKKVILVFIVILTIPAFKVAGQTVVSNAGTYSFQTNYSVNWTLGEVITSTISNSSTTLTQGFNQVAGTIVGIEIPFESFNFRIYPNPFEDEINIQVGGSFVSGTNFKITDLAGQVVVDNGTLAGTNTELSLGHLVPGIYFVCFSNSTNHTSYKIIKTK